ncbi:MAG: hypothetical protein ACO3VR_03065, partial [Lutimaribacter sp.]
IEWHRLRAGAGSLAEARAFLARNPDWPGLALLRKRTEAQAANASTADVLAFFASDPPQTGPGALAYARALVANGQKAAAAQMLTNLWPDLALDEGEFQASVPRRSDAATGSRCRRAPRSRPRTACSSAR